MDISISSIINEQDNYRFVCSKWVNDLSKVASDKLFS